MIRPMITTVEEYIDAIGGLKTAVKVFDAGSTSICNWRARDRFPPWAKARALEIARTNKMRVDPRLFEITRPKPAVTPISAAG